MNYRFLFFVALLLCATFLTAQSFAAETKNWRAVVPNEDTETWKTLAQEWLKAAGQTQTQILSAKELLDDIPTDLPTVVFGHAGINPLLGRWYARHLDSTDLIYPGSKGWILRWIPHTNESGLALIVGAQKPQDLTEAKSEFLTAIKQPLQNKVRLSADWLEVLEKQKEWWQKLETIPTFGKRNDSKTLSWFLDSRGQPLASPQQLPWGIWILEAVSLANRLAEDVHATAEPKAELLYTKALEQLIQHLPPQETFEPGQKNGETGWMWEYRWPGLMYGLLSNEAFVSRDPQFLKRLNQCLFASVKIYLQNSGYTAGLLGKTPYFGSRHELGFVLAVHLTTQYLLDTKGLETSQLDEVVLWRKNVESYFARAGKTPLFDDGPTNFDDVDVLAAYWLGGGGQAAFKDGGVDWAIHYLLGHADNSGVAASWGYEFERGDAPARISAPLSKLAFLTGRKDLLDWAARFANPNGGFGHGWFRAWTAWKAMRSYGWTLLPKSDHPQFNPLDLLPLSQERVPAMTPPIPEQPLFSITARTGSGVQDAQAVMMACNGVWWNNAVAGALIHFASHGESWLRGCFPEAYLASSHNRVSISGNAYPQQKHALKLTWKKTTPSWSGWGLSEGESQSYLWNRDVILFNQGSLLVVDRVSSEKQTPDWMTTWLPSATPQQDSGLWVMKQGKAKAWLLTDESQSLQLQTCGMTLDGQKLPSGLWVMRSLGKAASRQGPRLMLLAVGDESDTRPQLTRSSSGYIVTLPGSNKSWSIQVGASGLALQEVQQIPEKLEQVSDTKSFSQSSTDEIRLGEILQCAPTKLFEAPEYNALLADENEYLATNKWVSLNLPGLAKIKQINVFIRGAEKKEVQFAFLEKGKTNLVTSAKLSTLRKVNEGKGYCVDYFSGNVTNQTAIVADSVLIFQNIQQISGFARLQIFGEIQAAAPAFDWKNVRLWPQPDGSIWCASLDHHSTIRVIDQKGQLRWSLTTPNDCTWIEPSHSQIPQLAILTSDEFLKVLGPNGKTVWSVSLRQIAPVSTEFGNIGFRALWHDINQDGIDDLLIGECHFEIALDGRDGKLLGKSEFIPTFWANGILTTTINSKSRLWCAPSRDCALRTWDCPEGSTVICPGPDEVAPRGGGKLLFFSKIASQEAPLIVQGRENFVWAFRTQEPMLSPQWKNNTFVWCWNPPNCLTAGETSRNGTLLGDIGGHLYLLNPEGKIQCQSDLPEPASQILHLPLASSPYWWVTGNSGGGWLLDSQLKVIHQSAPGALAWQPFGQVVQFAQTSYWLAPQGHSLFLFSSKTAHK